MNESEQLGRKTRVNHSEKLFFTFSHVFTRITKQLFSPISFLQIIQGATNKGLDTFVTFWVVDQVLFRPAFNARLRVLAADLDSSPPNPSRGAQAQLTLNRP